MHSLTGRDCLYSERFNIEAHFKSLFYSANPLLRELHALIPVAQFLEHAFNFLTSNTSLKATYQCPYWYY